jgi:ubiquinol oxidase
MSLDLKKEQKATSERPRYQYSLAAKVFFFSIDLIAGRTITLSKVKLIEILAGIPYRAWETRQYTRMTRGYRDRALVRDARTIMEWAREAQDNEYCHLLAANEKMKEDGVKDAWYLFPPVPFLMAALYAALMHVMALVNIRCAFLFNAQFEDHAEHVYAQFVEEHPEWEQQPVNNEQVRERGGLSTWAEVFRRIGLDERDHMNMSFAFCDEPERVVAYDGMPEGSGLIRSMHGYCPKSELR